MTQIIKYYGEFFNCFFVPAQDKNSLRIIVSLKVTKKAVLRNRCRRLIKAVWPDLLKKSKQNIKATFIIKKNFSNYKSGQVKQWLEEILKKENLIS